MNIIIIFGIQGSGKGTQSTFISQSLEIPHLSTGQILRDEIAKESELGKKVKETIESGVLISDEMMNEIVQERIREDDCKKGFILDGYPRTQKQAVFLHSLLGDGVNSVNVIELDIPDEIALERMKERALTSQRADDTEEGMKKRIALFHKETAPLLEYFKTDEWYNVISIDGTQSIEEVKEEIKSHIQS